MEGEEPTCGRGLAQNSAVPATLAEAAAGLARNRRADNEQMLAAIRAAVGGSAAR